jgi:hypothetical protein
MNNNLIEYVRSILLLTLAVSVGAYGQDDCKITWDELKPDKDSKTSMAQGEWLEFETNIDLKKKWNFEYAFVRPATKKEIKKPDKIEGEYILNAGGVFEKQKVWSGLVYRDTGEINSSYNRIEKTVPIGIERVDINDYMLMKLEVVSSSDECLVLKTESEETLISYHPSRDGMFNKLRDLEEMEKRRVTAKNYIGHTMAVTDEGGLLTYVTVSEVIIEPFKTVIRIDGVSFRYAFEMMLDGVPQKKEENRVYYDAECYKSWKKELAKIEQEIERVRDSIYLSEIALKTEYDEFKKRTFYYDRRGLKRRQRVMCYVYYSKTNGSNTPREPNLYFSYLADDWLFINTISFLIDGKTHNYQFSTEREVLGGGSVEETKHIGLTSEMFKMFETISLNSKVKIRLNGKKYYHEVTCTEYQVAAFYHILKTFKEEGGKP